MDEQYITRLEALGLVGSIKNLQDFERHHQIRIEPRGKILYYHLSDLQKAMMRQNNLETQWPALIDYDVAAMILGVKRQAFMKWVERFEFMEWQIVKIDECHGRRNIRHVRSNDALQQLRHNPFFYQPKFGIKELAQMLDISPMALWRWQAKQKNIMTLSPGHKPYILYDQYAKCAELAIESRRFGPARKT